MAEHFLTKTKVYREDCLGVGQALAIERHAELQALLTHNAGPDVAALFAEPFISRSGDDGHLTIAWYTNLSGRGARLTELSEDGAKRIEARLVALTRPLVHMLEDSESGPLLRAALSVGSRADIWVIDDRPILVNWGMTTGARPSEGPLTGLIPMLTGPMIEARRPAPVATSNAAASLPVPPVAPVTAPVGTVPRIAWVPLTVLLCLSILVLLWLLLPSTRIAFPYAPPIAPSATVDTSAAQEATLRALADRKQQLEAALAGAQCRADGVLELPGGRSIDGAMLPQVGSPDLATETPAKVEPMLPLSPSQLSVGEADTTETLLKRLEGGTVLVIARRGETVSTGTGFSIGNGLIISNAHVLGSFGESGEVFVIHKSFAQPLPARVIKVTAPFEQSGTDLALLEVADKTLTTLTLMTNPETRKLTPVIAAGFPADVMETDSAYVALMQGDATAVPDLSVSDGIVTSEQQMPEGQTKLLFHTAPLSNGNSGGPLVDYCGSVVGVNTFVRRSELRSINIALSTADVVTFLEDTPAAGVMVQDQPCRPTIIAPRLPDAAPNPDAAVPEPAPDQPADVPKTDLAPQDTTEPTAPTDAPKSQGDE